jgi:hypothetical protein
MNETDPRRGVEKIYTGGLRLVYNTVLPNVLEGTDYSSSFYYAWESGIAIVARRRL